MILATAKYHLAVLKEFVRAGADLNLQNQVTLELGNRYSPSYISPPLGRANSSDDLLKIWQI